MANIIRKEQPSGQETLFQMCEDAKFDVADEQGTDTCCIPDLSLFSAPKAPPKAPKVFLSNDCRFNCSYCGCRCTNDVRSRYSHEPRTLAKLAVDAAIKNGHGVFVTSAICKSADYTEERIVETIRCMREELQYKGYIHAKVMPGTDPLLIKKAGQYANRLSVNIEVAQSAGYEQIAKQKNKDNIITPMRQISRLIRDSQAQGLPFATSQTTQLMAGSTGETDRMILDLSEALYSKYRLKRVYYTAFQYHSPAVGYDFSPIATPSWRMKRLYQADRLMQLYGFSPSELVPPTVPDLSERLDPKIAWALRNIERFPVELNSADYETLLRIPGIGVIFAKKLMRLRRSTTITHELLMKLGVPLRRSVYFLQCGGKYMGGGAIDHPERLSLLFEEKEPVPAEQLTFF